MIHSIALTQEDILHHLKLSCKLPEFIEKIVTCKVIEYATIAAGIQVTGEELQKSADQFRLIHKLKDAAETWAWLKQHHLSLDHFEEMIHINLSRDKLIQHLFADQIESYFVEHQLEYLGVVMYEVILDDQNLAMELFYAIQAGEMSFYEMARLYIQDPELRRMGGYQRVRYRRDLKPEISMAVFAAKSSQILKPIVTAEGVHLLLIEEIIQPELNELLRQGIGLELLIAWLKQQLEQVEVTFKDLSKIKCI
jgi:PPIC-type PPIASE domain